MIRKIVSIQRVGNFRDHSAIGDSEFRELTLIHAYNTLGKTTLCSVLRSLQTGDPASIRARKTLGEEAHPVVHVLLAGGLNARFDDGGWSTSCPNIQVFDSDFVSENVYSGDVITHDNKRNLCRVVLGAEGVKLAEAVDALDAKARHAAAELKSAKTDVILVVPKGIGFERFLALPVDPDVASKLVAKRKELKIAEQSDAVKSRHRLSEIDLPALPSELGEMLAKGLDGVADDAVQALKDHIATLEAPRGPESWLSAGVAMSDGQNCPFCAQSLLDSPTYDAMRRYFSEAYHGFQSGLRDLRQRVEDATSTERVLSIQKVVGANTALLEFWSQLVEEEAPAISMQHDVETALLSVRSSLVPVVSRKQGSPLDAIGLGDTEISAVSQFSELRSKVESYNEAVVAYNSAIDAIKASAEQVNPTTLQSELRLLEATELRHEVETVTVAAAYADALEAKSEIERSKSDARDKLDAYNEHVIAKYRSEVNGLLARFGAGFRLATVKVEYTGRTPRAAYTFEIRGWEVEPGSDRTPADSPSFRNTLSAGDKNTLALAFFIARIRAHTDLSNLVVVFDDPFTSLDSTRRHWTRCMLQRIAGEAKQVIVLSHCPDFLRSLAEGIENSKIATLEITKKNAFDSHLIPFDLNDATADQVEKDVNRLRSYCLGEEDDDLAAVRSIRPVLENHMRKMAPDACPPGNGWLGTFLGQIAASEKDSPLQVFVPYYDDFDALNSYTAPYAHDSGQSPVLDATELSTNAELTLTLIGRPVHA